MTEKEMVARLFMLGFNKPRDRGPAGDITLMNGGETAYYRALAEHSLVKNYPTTTVSAVTVISNNTDNPKKMVQHEYAFHGSNTWMTFRATALGRRKLLAYVVEKTKLNGA